MQRTSVDLARDRSRGIDALRGTEVPAVYSDAVRVDLQECSLLFISGMIGVNEEGKVVDRTMKGQTRQVLENIKRVLDHEGASFDDVVRVRVYVTQIDQQSIRDIHDVRSTFFTPGKYPASTLVRVDQLIRDGALIEIDADAVIPRR
jgi:2-iminobutanoate/2-iminopropanoate deaminase